MAAPGDIAGQFAEFVVAVKDRLKTILFSVSDQLEFGKKYFIKSGATFTLPDTTGRVTESVIQLNKASGLKPTIVVHGAQVIVVNGVEDTSVSYDIDRPILIVWDPSTGKWYI